MTFTWNSHGIFHTNSCGKKMHVKFTWKNNLHSSEKYKIIFMFILINIFYHKVKVNKYLKFIWILGWRKTDEFHVNWFSPPTFHKKFTWISCKDTLPVYDRWESVLQFLLCSRRCSFYEWDPPAHVIQKVTTDQFEKSMGKYIQNHQIKMFVSLFIQYTCKS